MKDWFDHVKNHAQSGERIQTTTAIKEIRLARRVPL